MGVWPSDGAACSAGARTELGRRHVPLPRRTDALVDRRTSFGSCVCCIAVVSCYRVCSVRPRFPGRVIESFSVNSISLHFIVSRYKPDGRSFASGECVCARTRLRTFIRTIVFSVSAKWCRFFTKFRSRCTSRVVVVHIAVTRSASGRRARSVAGTVASASASASVRETAATASSTAEAAASATTVTTTAATTGRPRDHRPP